MDGKRTDFAAALLNAERNFARAGGNPSEQRAVVLFSDGQLNVGTEDINRVSHDSIVKDILPRFKAAGIPIHAVAFSPKADLDFLALMAAGTGGQAFRANTPEDIYDAFVRLFEQAQQPLSVPLIDGQVAVDANVQELKLLVKREPGDGPMHLTDPGNRNLTVDSSTPGVDWQSTPDFDRITIQNPEAGSWKVTAGNGEKKAYIESNLDLNARLPVMAGVNETIRIAARLSYQGAPVDPSLLKNAHFSATVLDEADAIQQQVDLKPDPGGQNAQDYRGELRIPKSGSFQVRVSAEGLGFQRQKGYFISIVGAQQQAALSDLEQPDAGPAPPQQTALFLVLGGNLALVVLGGIGFAVWRWRRRRQQREEAEADDLTLD